MRFAASGMLSTSSKTSSLTRRLAGVSVEFKKHLFGGIASQCCAVMALTDCITKQENRGWTKEFCLAALKSFYSDDFLRSFSSSIEAVTIVAEIRKVLAENGYPLAKFRSNDKKTEQAIRPEKELSATEVTIAKVQPENEESALGVTWSLEDDVLVFRSPPAAKITAMTKRVVLSYLMSLFDPLGLVVPFVLPMKLFIQKLIVANYEWDDAREFERCLANIKDVEKVKVPRCYTTTQIDAIKSTELHVFADASSQVETQLVAAKNKVIPAKKTHGSTSRIISSSSSRPFLPKH